MKHLKTYLALAALALALPAMGQLRTVGLQLHVSASTGESLSGQRVVLTQTDYSLQYASSETTLDANGDLSIMIYPGNHSVVIERTGFATYESTFTAEADMSLTISLTESVREPFSLKATVDHDVFTGKSDVTLTWNREDPVLFDDFEDYEAFAVEFSPWTGIDGDRIAAAALTGSYNNRGALQYAQIINPMTVEPSWWYDYPVLQPYSGQQYAGFIRTASGAANDDWLISPAVTVGTNNIVRFMAKAADVYKERFEVGITTKTADPTADDFEIISSGNYETVSYEDWQEMEYDLSQYAGEEVKIGIHYIGCANREGAFMLMVDDFFIGVADYFDYDTEALQKARRVKAQSPSNPNESFEVYLNGTLAGTTEGYSYTFEGLGAGSYTLGVKSVYQTAQSSLVELPLTIEEGDYASLTFSVTTNNGVSPDGIEVELVDKATSEEYSTAIANGVAAFPYLPKATYMVNFDTDIYESAAFDLTFTAAAEVPVALTERIIDPYNITVDQTDNQTTGLVDAVVKWNQDLGFEDSFEDYEDFAVGEFGEWQSIDLDRGVVYPIGLGSTSNIVNFPGASTTSSPAAIAPMVFNPTETEPAMAPADAAAVAPTGDKYVIFFSPQQATANKWLISPAQTIRDGYVWQFNVKSYSSLYIETFELCVSTTDDSVSSFTTVATIQPSADYWETYSVDLSAYVGETVYLGYHYVSYDTFFGQLDDFYVGPADDTTAEVGYVQKYQVYLDGEWKADTTEPTYTFTSLTRGSHTVGLKAVYASGESQTVEYTFNAQGGVSSLTAGEAVEIAGGKGTIRVSAPHGTNVEIYNVAGQLAASGEANGDASFMLPAGLYIVRAGAKTAKVAVK